jgi:hypothetical protein
MRLHSASSLRAKSLGPRESPSNFSPRELTVGSPPRQLYLKFRHTQTPRALLNRRRRPLRLAARADPRGLPRFYSEKGLNQMDFRRKPFAPAALRLKGLLRFAAALMLAQIAFAASARAQQTTTPPPRRPSGPAASPIIKLPRGDNASLDQTQANSSTKEQAERAPAEPRRWEYCAITGIAWRQTGLTASSRTPFAVVRFFPDAGEEVEGNSEQGALANAFARLGDDGWELTGISTSFNLTDGNGTSASVYYFKRPRRTQQQEQ